MLKKHLKALSEYLTSKNLGPDKLCREFFDGWMRYSYIKQPRLFFEIHEHKVNYDLFRVRASRFDRNFTNLDISEGELSFESVFENIADWSQELVDYEEELLAIDPWHDDSFNPPKELTSGISTINFESSEKFQEEEQHLIEADLDKTKEFIRNEVGLDEDRLAVIERDIDEIKQELSKRSKFSWKEYAREKLIDELVNAAKDRFSLVQLYKLFEFLGPFDLPRIGI